MTGNSICEELEQKVNKPEKAAAAARDIATQKQIEETLRESESKFRFIFDLSPQPIALTEVETGRLADVNDKFCELTKYAKEEVVGLTTIEVGFYDEEDRIKFMTELQSSGEVNGLEMDFKAKDGSILNALM
ncbi:MAG: PAS domain S-box protein, partial [Proteobacteria bacterium]|nr:PAS domain S-box protein [Pseudomonadota bacterium]